MGILLRNWHLKLSAILLATVLYTGLVFSGRSPRTASRSGSSAMNPPDGSIVLSGDLGLVDGPVPHARDLLTTRERPGVRGHRRPVGVRHGACARAPGARRSRWTRSSTASTSSTREPRDRAGCDRPRRGVGRCRSRSTPARCRRASRSASRCVSAEEVQVRGAASLVGPGGSSRGARQHHASGINVNQPVDLRRRGRAGAAGRRPGFIDIEPETVSVQVDVHRDRDGDDRGRPPRLRHRHPGAGLRARGDQRRAVERHHRRDVGGAWPRSWASRPSRSASTAPPRARSSRRSCSCPTGSSWPRARSRS